VLQVQRSRRDAEDAMAQLEQCRRELMAARQNTEMEINKAFICLYVVHVTANTLACVNITRVVLLVDLTVFI